MPRAKSPLWKKTPTESPFFARDEHELASRQVFCTPVVKSTVSIVVIVPPVTVPLTTKTVLQVKVTTPVVALTFTVTVEGWPLNVHGEPSRAARLAGPAGPCGPAAP